MAVPVLLSAAIGVLVAVSVTACGAPAQQPRPSGGPTSASQSVSSAGPATTPTAASAKPSAGEVTVKYGQLTPPSVSDSGVLIANAKGWFTEQGIRLEVVSFDTAGNMTSPLGTNQIDAGGGSVGAGLFNAVGRGVPITIVADKGTTSPGHGYLGLVVRKALVDSGDFTGVADLRGKKIALSSMAIAPEVALADLLRSGGLTMADINIVPLAFPDMVVALANGTIDAAEPIEPFLTDQVTKGAGVLYKRADEYSPNSQNAVVLYSPAFAANTDVATRFMTAYLKGARLYADAFDKKDPTVRGEVIGILSQSTSLKDPALYDQVAMPGLAPDGRLNTASLQAQQQYYLTSGQQQTPLDHSKLVNATFAESAAAKLGPYR